MPDAHETTDVLVVGAGPTGLTLACDLDRDGRTHRRYGARSGAAVLVRPDGYVATRSPLDGDRVAEHVRAVLGPAPAGGPESVRTGSRAVTGPVR